MPHGDESGGGASPPPSDSDRSGPPKRRRDAHTSWHSVSATAATAAHHRALRAVAEQPDVGAARLTDISPSIHRPGASPGGPPLPQAWASALIVFSGDGHDVDLAARLRARGMRVEAIDIKAGGAHHDVRRGGLAADLEARVQRGDFDVVFLATPCSSYSVAHRPQLRSRRSPLGTGIAPPHWRRYIDKHNELADITARLIDAAAAAGVAWALENPADRGDRTSPAWWPPFANHAPIWISPAIRCAVRDAGGVMRTFAQCAFGAAVQKWTSIAHSPSLSTDLVGLDAHSCPHGRLQHEQQAHGLAPDGSFLSAAAAAYPPQMNEYLANALADYARRRWDAHSATLRGHGRATQELGGRVADGHGLSDMVAAACEAARTSTPPFASLRNRRPESLDALRLEAIPTSIHAPQAPTRPPMAAAARRDDAARQRAAAARPPAATETLRLARMLRGPIAIAELYLDGVYVDQIESWMRLADAACDSLRRGKAATRPPTRIITQEQMQPWARGIIWDCADPCDCRPVRRSTRDTVFRGARQLDRAALRRIAAGLDWHDHRHRRAGRRGRRRGALALRARHGALVPPPGACATRWRRRPRSWRDGLSARSGSTDPPVTSRSRRAASCRATSSCRSAHGWCRRRPPATRRRSSSTTSRG